jgi:NAD(P)-dependent dehydrogenase (short-subunit alcohol dehydrogenase family)
MLAKYGMTLAALGFAAELASDGIASNTLWPRTIIATAAVRNLLGGDEAMARSRTPEIMADAAHAILIRPPTEQTGQQLIDDEVLANAGIIDLSLPTRRQLRTPDRHLPRLDRTPQQATRHLPRQWATYLTQGDQHLDCW